MRLLREPTLQFLVLAAALFALDSYFGDGQGEAPARIVVSAAKIANLEQAYAKTWLREPTPGELTGLIDDHVRDEIYYREARALGLDEDDIVIRRRLRQKLEFFAEDMDAAAPTEADLAAYLAANADAFRREESVSFRHVFLSSKRGAKLESDAEQAAANLPRWPAAGVPAFGDAFLLGNAFESMQHSDVANNFGEAFAGQVFGLKEGSWQGPLASPFGLHFVYVDEHRAGRLPALDDVRGIVEREWSNARLAQRRDEFYRLLRDRYEVVIDRPAAEPAVVTGTAQ